MERNLKRIAFIDKSFHVFYFVKKRQIFLFEFVYEKSKKGRYAVSIGKTDSLELTFFFLSNILVYRKKKK